MSIQCDDNDPGLQDPYGEEDSLSSIVIDENKD